MQRVKLNDVYFRLSKLLHICLQKTLSQKIPLCLKAVNKHFHPIVRFLPIRFVCSVPLEISHPLFKLGYHLIKIGFLITSITVAWASCKVGANLVLDFLRVLTKTEG